MGGDQPGILLTGGIGSGKSTAAGMLAGYGAAVISADRAGHRVLQRDGAAFEEVARRWPQTLREGQIDRELLGEVVFADPSALSELESLTHPHIRLLLAEEVDRADAPLTVIEIPLLADPLGRGWPVVVVDAPTGKRKARLRARGMSAEAIRRRMALQPSRREWLAAADHIIDNGSDLAHLAGQCRRLWSRVVAG